MGRVVSLVFLALVTIPLAFLLGYLLSPDFWRHVLGHMRTGTDCCGWSDLRWYVGRWAAGSGEFRGLGGPLFSLAIPAVVWAGINGVYAWASRNE